MAESQFWIGVHGIIADRGRLVVLRRAARMPYRPGHWDLPGGHLTLGESFEDALAEIGIGDFADADHFGLAANSMAARIAASLKCGKASRIFATDSPAASLSRIVSTVILVPAMTGLPIMMRGLASINGSAI